jgi:AraC family transcriptional regulator
MMERLSRIPFVRATDGDVLLDNPFASVVLSSAATNWHNVVIEEHHFRTRELADLMFIQHVVAVNVGPRITCEFKKDGRFRRISLPKDAITLSPGQQPFFRRSIVEQNAAADVLLVALDPLFLSQTAAQLQVYPDRVELIEQQRQTDPTLSHIALALRAELQAGRPSERMYGESLATALAVHLLRDYAGTAVKTHIGPGELSRQQLMRAVDYIEAQLSEDLTVAAIAHAIHMSPYHFSRLFKKTTGKSPYQYVIEARATRAKTLLQSGQFSIKEVAYEVGFADQSHLTYYVKKFYGVTPKGLIERHI